MKPGEKHILIIEDDMQMRFYLMTLVKSLGIDPVMAADGEEGLKVLSIIIPDAIILDIMMPNKGGVAVYKELVTSRDYKNIPIVFFSGVDKRAFLHIIRMVNISEILSVPEQKYYVAKDADPQYLKTVLLKCIDTNQGNGHGI